MLHIFRGLAISAAYHSETVPAVWLNIYFASIRYSDAATAFLVPGYFSNITVRFRHAVFALSRLQCCEAFIPSNQY